MTDKPSLRLLKKPPELPAPSSFWRCCPIANEYLPESPCPEGQPKLDKDGKLVEEPRCDWWINSKNHNYCFWRYVRDKSDPDGVMKELVQSELAELFGFSNTKTHFVLKQAIEELKQALVLYDAIELLSELDSDEFEHAVIPEDLTELPRDESE